MEIFFWRTWARVVAHVDLVLSVLSMMGVITLIVTAGFETAAAKEGTGVFWKVWLFLAFLALITGIQIWASVKLLEATEFGRVVDEAFDKARLWKAMTFLFLVLDVVFVYQTIFGDKRPVPYSVVLVVGILISCIFMRGNFFFIVVKFMDEILATLDDVVGQIVPDAVIIVK